ncbi:hypothetical protein [Deinococcus saxicola]|uniref:hypothetical protein n=1 Tax=Deinococcus saxicola TaxID=249406 RepID=UPI0039EE3532
MKKRPDSHSGRFKGGDIPMAKHQKNTPKRRREPSAGDVAVILTAIAALLTGFAASLTALK